MFRQPVLVAIVALLGACAAPSAGVDWHQWTRHLQSEGLMRTDRGVTEAYPSAEELAVNFSRTAFANEADPWSKENRQSDPGGAVLRRWQAPIAYQVLSLGTDPQGFKERTDVFMARLASITGHPIRALTPNRDVPEKPEATLFIVHANDSALEALIADDGPLTADEDPDRRAFKERIRGHIADWRVKPSPCAFIFWHAEEPNETRVAGEIYFGLVLVRAEVPDLLRETCIEEELSQAMGLAADHSELRPSIFNDDSEFALLTEQDALLLKILYDPRLRPGMTLDEAMPMVRQIAAELIRDR